MTGTLYLVGTPIGNLTDISHRCRKILKTVDFIAAEDTRVSLKLLNHLNIKKPMVSYYEHNMEKSGRQILQRLLGGEHCALMTDAGMPAVSDPGAKLVALCAEAGVEITTVPGPTALISALALSGLETGRFTFEGFLTINKKNRQAHLRQLEQETRTMIFYEAPHKLKNTLSDLYEALGDRQISISRELTKLHEQTLRTSLYEAINYFDENAPRGEFVLVVSGAAEQPEHTHTLEEGVILVRDYVNAGLSFKDAVKKASAEYGLKKNSLYQYAKDDKAKPEQTEK